MSQNESNSNLVEFNSGKILQDDPNPPLILWEEILIFKKMEEKVEIFLQFVKDFSIFAKPMDSDIDGQAEINISEQEFVELEKADRKLEFMKLKTSSYINEEKIEFWKLLPLERLRTPRMFLLMTKNIYY